MYKKGDQFHFVCFIDLLISTFQRQQLQEAIVAVNTQESSEGVSMDTVVTAVETHTDMASLET